MSQEQTTFFQSMELEESEANSFIEDMIAVLQDGKELLQRSDAQIAVKKLQDLKNKDFIITTKSFEEIMRQIKEEMVKVQKSTENAPTKEEYEKLKNKLEIQISNLKEEIKRLTEEDSPQQKQLEYEKAKSEWRKKLIEWYHKTLLQVPTTPLQPKSEKFSFNEIYIIPKITMEIKGEKGATEEVEVATMSDIFTKNGTPQKSVYVQGDAGSGKTSFCKYLINCWCLAHNEADNENEDDSSKPEDDSEKHGDEGKKLGGVNEIEGGNQKHRGDYEEHEAGNENEDGSKKQGGNNEGHEKHGADNENEGDIVNGVVKRKQSRDIESEEGSKKHRGINEKQGDEKHVGDIKKHRSDSDDIQDEDDDLLYSDFYNDYSDGDLTDSQSDSDDFKYDSKSYELKFNGVLEMTKFDFLFYIPLRHHQNIDIIDEMLQKRYQMKILSTLLEEESSRVMILLDGLDEWSSENVPEHSIFKEYTIVTTSRPWKLHTLISSDVMIEQSLKLKGFDYRCQREMVDRTVSQLNVKRHEHKEAIDCFEVLEEKSLKCLKQIPIMLQQLICQWFDSKLDKTSRCAIYTGMLELFFTWNDMKTTGTSTRLVKDSLKIDLPKYLADKNILKLNSHFIYNVSQLAYEALFNCPKNKSLTFDICMFDELDISDEVRKNCLKLGIMREDECPSLSVSEPPSSLFSFIHKSMQEFVAAVNICINFNTKMGSSDIIENVGLAQKFICDIFQKCLTVNDILEQSNVVILLCGLEPRLTTHVSKYIYDTVSEDSRIQEYRRSVNSEDNTEFCIFDSYTKLIADIQKLFFESMKELNASCSVGSYPVYYIGDVVISGWNQYCDIVCSSIDQKQIAFDSVLSIYVNNINTENVKLIKNLPMFHHLEKIEITSDNYEDDDELQSISISKCNEQMINEINNYVSETIKVNTFTLKSLSLVSDYFTDTYSQAGKTLFSYFPSMINLVAIRMSRIKMSNDDTTSFCNFLEKTSHLEQIYLDDVKCVCMKQHEVNLSKHQQLQYLYLYDTVSVIDADTTHLELFRFSELKDSNYEKIFEIIKKSYKLKELVLHGCLFSESQLYHINITERLITVLPLLHNLSELELLCCRLTDSIIQSPLEMKRLKSIKLNKVIMSLTTWQKLVDSLPAIPHTVDVRALHCIESGEGEELNDMLTLTSPEGWKKYDAQHYVKDKDLFFHVSLDTCYGFAFSTKK
ncbi:uncharacterized protein LOC132743187 isoform X2 [Ruditapes philippinarum]|uniref:uncharacterized protein LOC132743187 isoform X2 n=1 Tax=Ruditapes philippinarum TaxID=129788 RepID=UPI00295B9D21|nr:uncharacterized protein LOC132743187 isoform X2 [Ruditapes philippinarum]